MHVAQVVCSWDPSIADPEALLDRYDTLTGWSEALLEAGAADATGTVRGSGSAGITRRGVRYVFVADGGPPLASYRTRVDPIVEALAGQAADVIHVNGLGFPAQVRRIRRELPAPALVLQDHKDGFHRDPFRRALHGRGTRAADAFFFTAAEMADPWRRAGLIGSDQPVYAVVPSSTTLRSDPAARRPLPGLPAVLWVGRLTRTKDPLAVLQGFERAAPLLPDAELTMVYGTDELVGAVEKRIARSATLAPRVHMIGAVPHSQMARLYGGADLFVSGSHHEGSGYALIEALACGAVPVVTDIPSFRALTGGGRAGVLWPAGQAAGFAHALIDAAQGDLMASRAAALNHFERELTWRVVGRRALAAYADVLARVRAARG